MGEAGSGFGGFKRDVVEDCVVLSIAELFQKKALVPGSLRHTELCWAFGKTCRSHAVVQVDADLLDEGHAAIRLRYVADGESIDGWIWLTVTKSHHGGRRWWFECPSTGRRVAKLYLPPGERRFASRGAHGLSYRSCQEGGSPRRSERRQAQLKNRYEAKMQSMLQDMIDDAMYETFEDYDTNGSIISRALPYADTRNRETIELRFCGELAMLGTILRDAARGIDALGGRGCAIVPLLEQGHELIVLAAIAGAERAICVLELRRDTGSAIYDFAFVTDIGAEGGFHYLEPSGWAEDEPRCKLGIKIDREIFS